MNRFIRLRAALSFNTNRLKSRKYKSGNIFDVAGAAVIFLCRDKNYLTQRLATRIFYRFVQLRDYAVINDGS